MNFIKTNIDGLIVIEPVVFEDERGYFLETFRKEEIEKLGIRKEFLQDSQSFSKKGVLRGIHLQKAPFAQAKLVRVVKGKVLDVAVDLRKNSKTYKKWFSIILDEKNKKMLLIPEGFAHGFVALEESIFQYKVTSLYNKSSEIGIIWNDPEIGIDWQLAKYGITPLISEKDKKLPSFEEIESSL
jgi:dTDP-4-dehydrorhamnose 3,5-epimerase